MRVYDSIDEDITFEQFKDIIKKATVVRVWTSAFDEDGDYVTVAKSVALKAFNTAKGRNAGGNAVVYVDDNGTVRIG